MSNCLVSRPVKLQKAEEADNEVCHLLKCVARRGIVDWNTFMLPSVGNPLRLRILLLRIAGLSPAVVGNREKCQLFDFQQIQRFVSASSRQDDLSCNQMRTAVLLAHALCLMGPVPCFTPAESTMNVPFIKNSLSSSVASLQTTGRCCFFFS
jgi:hypothetical protein